LQNNFTQIVKIITMATLELLILVKKKFQILCKAKCTQILIICNNILINKMIKLLEMIMKNCLNLEIIYYH